MSAQPFHRWRRSLGWADAEPLSEEDLARARRLAADVEWAAKRLPFPTKCLPRAMALSWRLRREAIGHTVVFAVRPSDYRGSSHDLHAWVDLAGVRILGDLPGPWVETLRLGDSSVQPRQKQA
ncbi:transglutaminase superfamily protein [Sphingomonas sp. F9_3S_D5_B_2]